MLYVACNKNIIQSLGVFYLQTLVMDMLAPALYKSEKAST